MSNYQQRWCRLEHERQALPQRRGIEGAEALVQDDHVRVLQKGPRQVQTTLLPLAELPAGLADDLLHPGRHAVEKAPRPSVRQICSASSRSPGRGGQPRPSRALKANVPIRTWFS